MKGRNIMYTEIKLNVLSQEIYQLTIYEKKLNRNLIKINELCVNLKKIDDSALHELSKKLKKISMQLQSQIENIKKQRITLEHIVKFYEQCEEQIADFETEGKKENVQYQRKWLGDIQAVLKENGIVFK